MKLCMEVWLTMKILYLNLGRDLIGAPEILRADNSAVIEVTSFREALKLIETYRFEAILIDDDSDPETANFAADVHRIWPQLAILLVSTRGLDLVSNLQSLMTKRFGATA